MSGRRFARCSRTVSNKTRAVLCSIGVMGALLASSVAPAAASASWVHNQKGPTVLLTCDQACGGTGRAIYVNNGTSVNMFCYVDAGWWTGNYATNRWFKVWVAGRSGLWFTHASYVWYQTSVPRC